MTLPGVFQRHVAVEGIDTLHQLIDVLVHLVPLVVLVKHVAVLAHLGVFVALQVNVHAAHGIHNGLEGVEADFYVAIHVDTVVVGNGQVQHFHGTGIAPPGIAQGVGSVDAVLAAFVTGIVSQLYIAVPQEGGHGQRVGFFVQGQQHDAIGQLAFFACAGILTNHQNVYNLAGFAIVRLGCSLCRCFGRSFGNGFRRGFLRPLGNGGGWLCFIQVADEGGQVHIGGIFFFKLRLGKFPQLGVQEQPRAANLQ